MPSIQHSRQKLADVYEIEHKETHVLKKKTKEQIFHKNKQNLKKQTLQMKRIFLKLRR